MKKGVIYILTNPAFPEYVKIGYTHNLEQRLAQLNRSPAIPYAFRAYAVYEVDKRLIDRELHKLIDSLNPDLRTRETFDGREREKEFFVMSAKEAYSLLESIAIISGTKNRLKRMTPEGHEVLAEQTAEDIRNTARKGPFRFSECGIPVGSEIVFVKDRSVVAKVVDDRHIEYNGLTTSMSALAQELLGSRWQVQGTAYFTYNGRKLTDIREDVASSEREI